MLAINRIRIVLLCQCGIFWGCATALPGDSTSASGPVVVEAAEDSAAEALKFANESRLQLEKSRQLTRELDELVARAETAERKCAALVARIPKSRPKCPACNCEDLESASGGIPVPGAGKNLQLKSAPSIESAKPTQTHTTHEATKHESGKTSEPEYSPSDAPIEKSEAHH